MNTNIQAKGGHLIVWWRALREVEPLLKGYVRLARAETAMAAASVKGVGVWFGVALVGTLCLLMSGVIVLMMSLREAGWPLWASFAWIAVPSAILAIAGIAWLAYTRRGGKRRSAA